MNFVPYVIENLHASQMQNFIAFLGFVSLGSD